MLRSLPGCLVVLALCFLVPRPVIAAWQLQEVDTAHRFGQISFRLDPSGSPAFAYGQGRLYYASKNQGSWKLESVEEECLWWSYYQSLAFDGAGHPAICYLSGVETEFKLARWSGTSWSVETIPLGHACSRHSLSLAFDSAGRPFVSYLAGNVLMLARWNGTSWDFEVVDDEPGVSPERSSLALDGAGLPVIAYYDSDRRSVRCARWNGTVWRTQVVEDVSLGAAGPSLAINGSGQPAISYEDRLATWNGTGWEIETVDGVGDYASLAFDLSGRPAIASRSDSLLMLSRRDGVGWQTEVVDSRPQSTPAGLAFDSAGRPVIGYTNRSPSLSEIIDLEVARWNGSSWDLETVDHAGTARDSISLAYDVSGHPAVSYEDESEDDLMFARWDGTAWEISLVDTRDGEDSSLAFDADGQPAISYEGAGLRLARWNGTGWDIDLVDSSGWLSSLAFDHSGRPGISYINRREGTLKFAYWDDGTWLLHTIAVGSHTSHTSLAFDSEDLPAISYYSPNHLEYARWNGTDWDIEVVDAGDRVGKYASLAFDASDYPAIGYYDEIHDALKLARWNGSRWNLQTLESGGGSYSSLVVDSRGHILIAYAGEGLRLAQWDGTSWAFETADSDEVGHDLSLALDPRGRPSIAYGHYCTAHLRLATRGELLAVHRGSVADLRQGWKSAALPLDSSNDDETPPFPIHTATPATEVDPLVTSDLLVLYRALGPGDQPLENRLLVGKSPAGVEIRYE